MSSDNKFHSFVVLVVIGSWMWNFITLRTTFEFKCLRALPIVVNSRILSAATRQWWSLQRIMRTCDNKLFESKMFHIPETQKYFFMSHFYIIINGKNSISLDNIIWNETVVQTVLSYFYDLSKTANKQCEKLHMRRKLMWWLNATKVQTITILWQSY